MHQRVPRDGASRAACSRSRCTSATSPPRRPWGAGSSPGATSVLTVSDTGVGMDRETLGRIFDPYFTTKGKGKGTGLGLAVVDGIVRDHDGRIGVYSEPGAGTTFRVYLPLTFVDAPGVHTHVPAARPASVSGSERVLVVDDEESIRTIIARSLRDAGYRVAVFGTAADALETLARAPADWDLLITDMTMPGMSGKELATRAMELRAALPVILCCGYSSLISADEALKLGIRRYVEKPVEMRDLLETVRQVLDAATTGASGLRGRRAPCGRGHYLSVSARRGHFAREEPHEARPQRSAHRPLHRLREPGHTDRDRRRQVRPPARRRRAPLEGEDRLPARLRRLDPLRAVDAAAPRSRRRADRRAALHPRREERRRRAARDRRAGALLPARAHRHLRHRLRRLRLLPARLQAPRERPDGDRDGGEGGDQPALREELRRVHLPPGARRSSGATAAAAARSRRRRRRRR